MSFGCWAVDKKKRIIQDLRSNKNTPSDEHMNEMVFGFMWPDDDRISVVLTNRCY